MQKKLSVLAVLLIALSLQACAQTKTPAVFSGSPESTTTYTG